MVSLPVCIAATQTNPGCTILVPHHFKATDIRFLLHLFILTNTEDKMEGANVFKIGRLLKES
jgi:hypothetical protein